MFLFLSQLIRGSCCSLADDAENVAGVDSSALGNCDGGNGTSAGSEDLVFHLHGLEDEEEIALLDSLHSLQVLYMVL